MFRKLLLLNVISNSKSIYKQLGSYKYFVNSIFNTYIVVDKDRTYSSSSSSSNNSSGNNKFIKDNSFIIGTDRSKTTVHCNSNSNSHSHSHSKMQCTTSNQSIWSSFILFDQTTERYLLIKNNNGETNTSVDQAIPQNFYGFPSLNILEQQKDQKQQEEQLTFLNQFVKVVGNEKKDCIFFIGNLLAPFYAFQLKRQLINYYLVAIKDDKQIDLEKLQQLFPNHSYQWIDCKDNNLLESKFNDTTSGSGGQWLTTPETRRVSNVVCSLTRDNLHLLMNTNNTSSDGDTTALKREDDNHVGIYTPLEYAPGIESVPIVSNTVVPFFSTNLIVCRDGADLLLVDPGASEKGKQHFENILQSSRLNDVKPENVTVFLTHEHKDHWEGLPVVEKHFPTARLVSHQECIDVVNDYTTLKKVAVTGQQFSRRLSAVITSENESAEYQPIDNANSIVVGKKIFDVVATPGHTSNSLCLFERKSRTLIAGDHIVGWGSTVLDDRNGSMKKYLESTQSMIDVLQPKIALPAHGPACYDPILLLQTFIKHRLAREKSILEAYKSGQTTLQQLLSAVYRDLDPKLHQLAMMNIRLHLDKLKEDGAI
ncbi:hypothetical protein PPL_00141 [Heterostelium album PN500]|uniref:Metallo-beta-lactamase domain-containing protein n=1 Tax=Heterostelium pallidum (strain ATCC 26659 / Pp 5 / PN500) TaxID=670386 RepID=D3AVM6_HETP5|nr:hypothetical protein PPL_00141 [Heterostelium album PN500]EFA86349.1 hypothetical protein PPL_00141 [Heterostelium album PN500]|eukprot:XP_020438454.1 hypothetical protein PPL_00141 [Heterostelium album PN500]